MSHLIKKQINLATKLRTLLLEENEALSQRNTDKIQSLSIKKHQQVQILERLAQQQTTATIDTQEDQAALQKILAQCQQQNLNNGALIAAGRQSVETALAILRGQDNPKKTSYGPNGQAVIEPGNGRCLAQT